ncbi:DUF1642 domain-containing protein [Lactococcus cremoris]|uniref:DUF1642 domain-containing protein n=1 Tax=Lactococcus lactis subsp. cremoris TaxID=1359 RepID=UPI00223C3E2B|nr:DUF1642 domain-containing protein [Lactococcus cremoris]MCT0509185.1 DUF1642 domain-containing protein [Lactococcus cremoris]
MTKFEEELSVLPVSKSTNYAEYWNKAQLLTVFKDWQPQQSLPVVPEFIGKLINTFGAPEDGKHINYSASYLEIQKELDWIDNHQKTWLTALLIGFRVEKPQLFYLREKNTNYYLNKSKNNGLELVPNPYFDEDNQFTKQEIDSMQTGSYELVPVEDGE